MHLKFFSAEEFETGSEITVIVFLNFRPPRLATRAFGNALVTLRLGSRSKPESSGF